jgi:hypothetical protein
MGPSSEPTDYVSANCQDINLQLDSSGRVNVEASDINNGSKGGIAKMVLSQTSFHCANIGDNSVTLTAIDVNMNTDSCQAAVTISDSVVPNARCNDSTITLDAGKRAVVSVEDIIIPPMLVAYPAFR